ncbi:hypothetical protein HKCCE3408_14205 [Rhodobacterales bacterium HKCCE3408]|nr:hypothetical protein [Rhodobacterales bacterium HKCCE3408]
MNWKRKKPALMGVVGALGVVAVLAGTVGGVIEVRLSIFIALTIWILGATLVNLLAR